MDDMEEFKQVFFAECEELLGDLDGHLAAVLDGDYDGETLNAAFRAVHSIKGGADAFGLSNLVSFAHGFETVLDKVRSNELEPTHEVASVLQRAGDVISTLVERAQSGADAEALPQAEQISEDLKELLEDGGGGGEEPKSESAAPEPETEEAEPEVLDTSVPITYSITFAPGPDFFRCGHDPLRVLNALRELGPIQLEVEGEAPPLGELDVEECPYTWSITLESETPPAEIDLFFEIYQATADIDIEFEAPEPTVDAVEEKPAEAPPPIANASEQKEKPAQKQVDKPASKAARTLRVDLDRVDQLVNLVGELVITQAVLAQNLADSEDVHSLELQHATEALSRQTRELQESVMSIRAQPLKSVFTRMGRLARDLASQLGKEAKIEVRGENTEVDATVIEEISEPLTHMLRNSLDHGLETPDEREAAGKSREGTVTIGAEHRGERVLIIIEDDGRGVNRERVLNKAMERGLVEPGAPLTPEEIDMLIFAPGFSTAEQVSNVSGRGVGMDVVKRKIHSLGGRVSMENRPGQGARFIITLPLTLAVLDGMTIGVGEERFVLPLSSVVEAVKVNEAKPQTLPSGAKVVPRRGDYLPLVSLRDALSLEHSDAPEDLVVVVDTDTDGMMGLLIDELIGQRQVVLKSLETNFHRVDGVSGATILGDGRVALILDVPALRNLGASGASGGFMEMMQ